MGEIFLPNNTGGVMYEDPSATVDNIFVILSGGKKYRRQPDGIFRASWVVGLTSSGDKTSQMQAIYNHSSVTEVVLDSGDVTINGTLTVPAGKKTSFKNNGRIIGTGTLNLKAIDAPMDQAIFATSLTVNFTAVSNSSGNFSGKWFGAKGDASVDDAAALQKCIDTVIRNNTKCKTVYIPHGNYIIYSPLIIYKWDNSNVDVTYHRYNQVTLTLKGEYEHSGTAGTGTRILFSNNNLFAIGIQQGKRCKILNLSIEGGFAPSFSSDFDFFSRSLAAYTDGVRRDTVHSPHCGIAIDPFSNRPSVSGKPYFGDEYPGYVSWYRGGVNGASLQAGCTGTRIEDCYIAGFVVSVGHSLNGETKNAEITQILDCQFAVNKVAIAGGQDQEKCNKAIGIMCWQQVHTVFATGLYGNQIPGNWYIEKVNLAGTVQQLVYFEGGGYYPTYIKDVFAERIGRVGFFGTKLKCHISDSTFDFSPPEYGGGYYDFVIEGDYTQYTNCVLRYYGSAFGIPVCIRGKNYFDNCSFAVTPYAFDTEMAVGMPSDAVDQTGPSVFTNCTSDIAMLGDSQGATVQSSFTNQFIVYGKKSFRNLNSEWSGNESIEEIIDGGKRIGDIYWANVFNATNNVTITIGTDVNRTSVINVGAAHTNKFRVGGVVVTTTGLIAGYVQSINTGTNQVTMFFTGAKIISGNSYIIGCYYPRTNNGSFIGNTNGTNQVTNVVFDSMGPDGSTIVGSLVDTVTHFNYAFSGKYQRLAKVVAYNSGTKTITLDQSFPITATGVYFSLGHRKKIVRGINDIGSIPDNTILLAGSEVNVLLYPSGVERYYVVTKTGFADAAGIGGGETRQAEWFYMSKQALNAYTTDAESSAYTGATDGEAKLADLNALRVAYENLRASHDDIRTKLINTGLFS